MKSENSFDGSQIFRKDATLETMHTNFNSNEFIMIYIIMMSLFQNIDSNTTSYNISYIVSWHLQHNSFYTCSL